PRRAPRKRPRATQHHQHDRRLIGYTTRRDTTALDHPCAILDSQVAATLRDTCKWDSLGENEWPTSTYVRYCALLDRWAHEESSRFGRRIGIDEIERWLFRP
ncbi:hypothetical protein ACFWAN_30465, partial [Streptomyces mirabilis]